MPRHDRLLLLRHLLETLELDADNVVTLGPCDYFDVTGGKLAGGLNALMLGRLGFSIGEARIAWPIRAFSRCTEHIFKEDEGVRKALTHGHMFELARLEQAVNE
jgi:hypothetical protein